MAEACQGHAPLRLARAGASRRPRRAATILEAAQRLFERAGLRGDDDGRDRGRGRRRAEDRLRRVRDQERGCCARCGTCSCAATRPTSRSPSARGTARSSTSPTPSASCGSTRATRAWSRSAPRGCMRRDPRRRARTDADIAALWRRIQSDFYDNQRAIVETPRGQGSAASRTRRRARHRHPLDAQPPRRLAAAGRRARLDAEQWERWFADTACAQLLAPPRRRKS